MQEQDTYTLRDALTDLAPCVERMRRNIGHVVQPGPAGWRRAAAAALVYNAAEAADVAQRLRQSPRPTAEHVRLIQDLRAVDLGRQVDRVRRLWEEKAGGEPLEDVTRTLDALRFAVRLCRKGAGE